MTGILVRELRLPQDRDRVTALYQETVDWHSGRWPMDSRSLDVSAMFEEFPPPDDLRYFRVAEIDGQVVGLISAHLTPPPEQGMDRYDGPVVYVGDIVVTASARCAGIGTELMRRAEQWARERGAATITLQVHAGNDAAQALYRHQGYRDVDVRMRKDLS